jgi:hypothetical protein
MRLRLVKPSKRDVWLAAALYGMNVFDMAATLAAIRRGYEESNPLMRCLIELGPIYFILFKVIGAGALTTLLLFVPISKRINVVLLFLAGVYFMLAVSHLLIFWSTRG